MTVVAVVGSRSFASNLTLERVCKEICKDEFKTNEITHFVSGGAVGPDSWGEEIADAFGVEKTIFYPDWEKYGRSAGFRRNEDIVKMADLVVAFWDGTPGGTRHDLDLCEKMGKEVSLYTWDGIYLQTDKYNYQLNLAEFETEDD